MEKLEPFKNPNSWSYFWIGATRPVASKSRNGWKFVNGEINGNGEVNGDWFPNEPNGIKNENCLVYYQSKRSNSGNFGWGDNTCGNKHPFVCEVSTNTGR